MEYDSLDSSNGWHNVWSVRLVRVIRLVRVVLIFVIVDCWSTAREKTMFPSCRGITNDKGNLIKEWELGRSPLSHLRVLLFIE